MLLLQLWSRCDVGIRWSFLDPLKSSLYKHDAVASPEHFPSTPRRPSQAKGPPPADALQHIRRQWQGVYAAALYEVVEENLADSGELCDGELPSRSVSRPGTADREQLSTS